MTYLNADVRVCKAPPHVGHVAMVCARGTEHVGVLALTVLVARSHDGGSISHAPGQGFMAFPDRIYLVVIGVAMIRGEWLVLEESEWG